MNWYQHSVPRKVYSLISHALKEQSRVPLCATLIELHRSEIMPTDKEISAMEAVLTVMKPIVEISSLGRNGLLFLL